MEDVLKKTILSLDVGEKRVGVALCPSGTLAIEPLRALKRGGGEAERVVLELIVTHAVDLVVAGLPLDARDQLTEQCENVQRFCRRVQKRSGVEVEYQDEYLSSEEAKEYLGLSGREAREKRSSGEIDSISAMIILRRFLRRLEG